MEYAQLKPGRRFAPLQSLLYYSQRIVTYPSLRRLVVRALSGAVCVRHGSGKELHAATPAEEAALIDLRRSGYGAGQCRGGTRLSQRAPGCLRPAFGRQHA